MQFEIINDIRNFIFTLSYLADSIHFQNRASTDSRPRNIVKDISHILNSKSDSHYYTSRSLNERVQQLDAKDAYIKGIWNTFYEAVVRKDAPARVKLAYETLKDAFPLDLQLGVFSDTDLVIIDEDFPGQIPLNGIKESDLDHMYEIYLCFLTKIKFDNSATPQLKMDYLWKQVHKDLRVLMSRPLGRDLIEKLLNSLSSSVINLCSDKVFKISYSQSKIRYNVDPEFLLNILPTGEIKSLFCPPFIGIAHELIHLLHKLKSETRHSEDPNFNPAYTEPEELRTIEGRCSCSHHLPDPICENSLRREFSFLLQRYSHKGGLGDCADPDTKFANAVISGADGDLEPELLNRVSSPMLDEAITAVLKGDPKHALDPGHFARLLGTAKNPRYDRHIRLLMERTTPAIDSHKRKRSPSPNSYPSKLKNWFLTASDSH